MELVKIKNGGVLAQRSVPSLGDGDFRSELVRLVNSGGTVCSMFASPSGGPTIIYAVIAFHESSEFCIFSTVVGDEYESLTPAIPQVHMFEREMAEQYGVIPKGHPWLKPVRFQTAHNSSGAKTSQIGVTGFFSVEGEDIHEVAVGPVHAGVIEPGHFRFQCHGEKVFNLEISLGYQHRGIEKALIGGPHKLTMAMMETAAGDATIGHGTAYCQAVEALSGTETPIRAQYIRALALELERLANHAGDLGMLAQDVGYLPASSFCGRLRGEFLNLSQEICGNRFGRCLLTPGGVRFDVSVEMAQILVHRLEKAGTDLRSASGLLWSKPSVIARFENTGTITKEDCANLGIVGVAARACGVARDVRQDFPAGAYKTTHTQAATWDSGDVMGRARVRRMEVDDSLELARRLLIEMPPGPVKTEVGGMAPGMICVSATEGWRGEIVHVALTGDDGGFTRYKIVDPSFHNWTGLALALRGQEISDFPLCNKSFNLSYCGFDL
ncbi:MAG: NADH-quinone oxidoreductase subunit C [Nitrospinae bacterium]|nr:NADH-quinone oxidoreductase subunit C [Nitrospinota bacterium]